MYGGIYDWHTLEGPSVRQHAGATTALQWRPLGRPNYGVDYGVADSVLGPYSDAGNEAGPRVLRSIPGCVLGPGHNCIILGPDRQTSILFTMPGITWRCGRCSWTD